MINAPIPYRNNVIDVLPEHKEKIDKLQFHIGIM